MAAHLCPESLSHIDYQSAPQRDSLPVRDRKNAPRMDVWRQVEAEGLEKVFEEKGKERHLG